MIKKIMTDFLPKKLRELFLKPLLPILVGTLAIAGIIFAWTEPTSAPPAGNLSATLNIGSGLQIKDGWLYVSNIVPPGNAAGFAVLGGNAGIGTTTPATKLDVVGLIRIYQTATTSCSASIEGSIFYNSSNKHFWGCDGVKWNILDN